AAQPILAPRTGTPASTVSGNSTLPAQSPAATLTPSADFVRLSAELLRPADVPLSYAVSRSSSPSDPSQRSLEEECGKQPAATVVPFLAEASVEYEAG